MPQVPEIPGELRKLLAVPDKGREPWGSPKPRGAEARGEVGEIKINNLEQSIVGGTVRDRNLCDRYIDKGGGALGEGPH